jgi:membrane protein implicated in regulation of membrane protease activity
LPDITTLITPFIRGIEMAPLSKTNLNYSENIAVVEKAIVPSYKGRVRYQGISWLAQCEKNIEIASEDRVFVVGRRNITLIVEPLTA